MSISVLQSVYNNDEPSYLDQALESLYSQTLKADEIIIVEDGVVNNQLKLVIKKWKEKLPLKIVGYENNYGLAYAMNYGLQFVTSDYVARMDSDDICCPERFEKQIELFNKYPEIVICGSGISEFYEDKTSGSMRLYPCVTDKKSKKLFKGTPLAHPTVMIRTDILKKYKYNDKLKKSQDIDLWFRLLCDGYIIRTIQEPLLYFRITDATFKRRSISKAFVEFNIYVKYLFRLFGINWRFFFPVARLCSRLLPAALIKKLYFLPVRQSLLK